MCNSCLRTNLRVTVFNFDGPSDIIKIDFKGHHLLVNPQIFDLTIDQFYIWMHVLLCKIEFKKNEIQKFIYVELHDQ